MTYTPEQLEAAAEVYAVRMHEGQLDKAGQPYVEHLRRVAERMPTPELRIVAWLHDIAEDTYTSLTQVQEAFGPEIGVAVDAITRRPAEHYSDYIRRVGRTTWLAPSRSPTSSITPISPASPPSPWRTSSASASTTVRSLTFY